MEDAQNENAVTSTIPSLYIRPNYIQLQKTFFISLRL
jgi:hypothetical protein